MQKEVDDLIEMTSRLEEERNFLRRQLRSLIGDVNIDIENTHCSISKPPLHNHEQRKSSERHLMTSATCSCLLAHLLTSNAHHSCSHSSLALQPQPDHVINTHAASRSTTMTSVNSAALRTPELRNLHMCTCSMVDRNFPASQSAGALQVLSRHSPSLFNMTSAPTHNNLLKHQHTGQSQSKESTKTVSRSKVAATRPRPLSAVETSFFRV